MPVAFSRRLAVLIAQLICGREKNLIIAANISVMSNTFSNTFYIERKKKGANFCGGSSRINFSATIVVNYLFIFDRYI